MKASRLTRAAYLAGFHAWRLVNVGSPCWPFYSEQCGRCPKRRNVRWLTR